MLNEWHAADILESLTRRGWDNAVRLEHHSYEVGRAYQLTRGSETLNLYFVADLGTGYSNERSIESVLGLTSNGTKSELWLLRTRSGKWRAELQLWANTLSAQTVAGSKP